MILAMREGGILVERESSFVHYEYLILLVERKSLIFVQDEMGLSDLVTVLR